MKKVLYSIISLLLLFVISSCATHVYSRVIIYKKADGDLRIRETLTIGDDNFRFVKQTVRGKAIFKGHFKEENNTWTFEISSFKPLNAPERFFNPPIIYVYSVKKNAGKVLLSSPRVKGVRSPLQFIMRGSFSY